MDWSTERRRINEAVDAVPEGELRARLREFVLENQRLRWGVVANAGRTSHRRMVRWGHVKAATGFGSTSSIALCVAAGFDPDEECGLIDDEDEDDNAEGE